MAECQFLLRDTILIYRFRIKAHFDMHGVKNLAELKNLEPTLEFLTVLNELQEAKKTIAVLELMSGEKIEEYRKRAETNQEEI